MRLPIVIAVTALVAAILVVPAVVQGDSVTSMLEEATDKLADHENRIVALEDEVVGELGGDLRQPVRLRMRACQWDPAYRCSTLISGPVLPGQWRLVTEGGSPAQSFLCADRAPKARLTQPDMSNLTTNCLVVTANSEAHGFGHAEHGLTWGCGQGCRVRPRSLILLGAAGVTHAQLIPV